jgi:hypothetical protein
VIPTLRASPSSKRRRATMSKLLNTWSANTSSGLD